MYRIGDKVKLTAEAKENECYNNFKDKVLVITHIARNEQEHKGYDNSMRGMPLYDFSGIPCSLYLYEITRA